MLLARLVFQRMTCSNDEPTPCWVKHRVSFFGMLLVSSVAWGLGTGCCMSCYSTWGVIESHKSLDMSPQVRATQEAVFTTVEVPWDITWT